MSLPVVKYELVRKSGNFAATVANACFTPGVFVTSPFLTLSRAMCGGCSPEPKIFSVRWLVSYAEYPGIENCSSQRFETWFAAKAPRSVRAIHRLKMGFRCVRTARARPAIMRDSTLPDRGEVPATRYR